MLMLEHDAKETLLRNGVPVPRGVLAATLGADGPPFPGPWVVKAQVPTGGRGKAGGIRQVDTSAELLQAVSEIVGMRIKSHAVRECRVEQAVSAAREVYLSFSIDPQSASVRILFSAEGGVDIEAHGSAGLIAGEAAPDRSALVRQVERLAAQLPAGLRNAVSEAGTILGGLFLDLEAILIEINPLFVHDDGRWLAGDAKIIVDDNALPRQDELRALLERRAAAYPDVAFKYDQGFDFVVLDEAGEIGLVTTGAGLSMKLVDELVGQGVRPFNFCDIRTGQMRGDPARLIHVLGRIAEGRRIKGVLVNIFAGITDLGEFAQLLVTALRAVPALDVPVVARLVGNGEDKAALILSTSGLDVTQETDLDRAVAMVVGGGARHA